MLKPKYFLYARKSTEDDDHQIMSIEAQLFELREYARRENVEILQEFTEAKSAKKPGREMFAAMIAEIEKLDGVGILAWHPDRLARNSVDGGKVVYLVDTQKIVSLRFPTFWFEPTPQGLFMLQVAFGQSKYYSDNLVENINRGIRQKLRRGEWLTKAPFGYVNNPKTRTIEPHPTLSKVIVRAFEEYAKGTHTLKTMAEFLAELGLETRHRTPLAKASISRMLTNRAYLGLVKHKGEYHEGRFEPILSATLFEAVQNVLLRRAKQRHDFPFTGLLNCGECGSAITAQFSRGKCGGIYRYYRCTKKKGACSQKYLQEIDLAAQLKARFKSIAICDECISNRVPDLLLQENDLFKSFARCDSHLHKIQKTPLISGASFFGRLYLFSYTCQMGYQGIHTNGAFIRLPVRSYDCNLYRRHVCRIWDIVIKNVRAGQNFFEIPTYPISKRNKIFALRHYSLLFTYIDSYSIWIYLFRITPQSRGFVFGGAFW